VNCFFVVGLKRGRVERSMDLEESVGSSMAMALRLTSLGMGGGAPGEGEAEGAGAEMTPPWSAMSSITAPPNRSTAWLRSASISCCCIRCRRSSGVSSARADLSASSAAFFAAFSACLSAMRCALGFFAAAAASAAFFAFSSLSLSSSESSAASQDSRTC